MSQVGSPSLRVLMLSTGPWHAGARQLALGARALHEDGVSVQALTPSAEEWRRMAPAVPVERLREEHGTRAHRTAVTAAVEAARPTVVITDDELLRRVAVRALEAGACVLQRLPLGASLPEDSVATRFVSRNVAPAWLVPSLDQTMLARSTATAETRRIPAVPLPFAVPPIPAAAECAAPRRLVIIPDVMAPQAATSALRIAAMVARRHGDVRITLHGAPVELQPLRVHAAALRVASQVDVRPMPTFDALPPADVLAVWVAVGGDAGATAALWAMAAGAPVVVPADSAIAALVDDQVSGLLVPGGSPSEESLVAAALSRLLAHREERVRAGEAARQCAQQYDPARLARALRTAIERALAAARR